MVSNRHHQQMVETPPIPVHPMAPTPGASVTSRHPVSRRCRVLDSHRNRPCSRHTKPFVIANQHAVYRKRSSHEQRIDSRVHSRSRAILDRTRSDGFEYDNHRGEGTDDDDA